MKRAVQHKAIFSVIAAALALAACVSAYIPPDGGDTAEISFFNDSDRVMQVAIYKDPAECTDRSGLNPLLSAGETRTTRIVTGADIAMSVAQDTSTVTGCLLSFDFTPQKGDKYLVHYRQAPGGCRIAVTAAASGDLASAPPRNVAIRIREFVRPFDEHGPWCTPLK